MKKGSPEGYNAETGLSEPAQKPQTGEPTNFAAPPTDVSSPSTFGVTQTVQSAENGGNRVEQMSLCLDF